MSDFKVTPPQAWRDQAIMQVTLGNGMNVELRRPNIMAVVFNGKSGDVPHGLRQQLIDQLQGKPVEQVMAWQPGQSEDDLPQLGSFMETVVRAAFVNPVIVDDPDMKAKDPYQIAYAWLDDATIGEVFGLVMGGATAEADAAATFPDGT